MPRRSWRCRGDPTADWPNPRWPAEVLNMFKVSAVPPRRSARLTVFRGATAITDGTTAEPRRSWRCHCGLCRTSTAVAPRLRCDGGITRTRARTALTHACTYTRIHTCTSYQCVHLNNIIITLLLQFQIRRWVKCKMRRRVHNFTLLTPHSCLYTADGSTAMRKRPSYTLTCWFMCNHNYASRQSSPRYRQHINIAYYAPRYYGVEIQCTQRVVMVIVCQWFIEYTSTTLNNSL